MLLQEINAEGENPFELANIVKLFPRTYLKIIRQLVGKPHKLKYQGLDLFDEDGEGPGLHAATTEVKRHIAAGDCKVDIALPVPELHGFLEYEAAIKDVQHVWTAYDLHNNKLLLGFDAWISEDDFNEQWDSFFEATTDEEFDYDNPEHEEIFSKVHQTYMKIGFYGLLYEVSMSPHMVVDADLLFFGNDGFFKGVLGGPFLKSMRFVEL